MESMFHELQVVDMHRQALMVSLRYQGKPKLMHVVLAQDAANLLERSFQMAVVAK
jgi:hypothetical protein